MTVTVTVETVGGATGAVTVTVFAPIFPSLVARIVDVPAAIAVIVPDALMVASDGMELVHAIVRPVSTLPAASVRRTVACDEPPAATVAGVTVTATFAIGAGAADVTASVAAPDTPSDVAVMVTLPAAMAVTTPDADTVASVGSTLDLNRAAGERIA